MKYINNWRNYVSFKEDCQKYMEQFVEKESYAKEHKMKDVLYYFLPAWHI